MIENMEEEIKKEEFEIKEENISIKEEVFPPSTVEDLSIYYDFPITRMLPGNHPSRQPSVSLRSEWVAELACHVQ